MSKPTEIVVAGEMVRDAYHVPAGTIRVYRRDDSSGRRARRGAHTNWGYSGYYLASIYDGTSWRKLQFNYLIPYHQRSYDVARDCPGVEAYLQRQIRSWRGQVAVYDPGTRSFRILAKECVV